MELADLTTLGVGVSVLEMVVTAGRAETVAAVAEADRAGRRVLVLGAGSNIVAGDAGFDGRVIRSAATGRSVAARDGWIELTAEAGEPWARLVDMSVAENLAGFECLAAIPGSVGAVPVQNVGAHGQEVAATICRLGAWDRRRGGMVCLDGPACRFRYRSSRFKTDNRFVKRRRRRASARASDTSPPLR